VASFHVFPLAASPSVAQRKKGAQPARADRHAGMFEALAMIYMSAERIKQAEGRVSGEGQFVVQVE
jgi:hypothetical protein